MEFIDTTCFRCGNEEAKTFLVEQIPCSECDHVIYITYNKCSECGVIWKEADGNIFSMMEIEDLFFPDGIPDNLIADLVDLDEVPVVEHVMSDEDSMEGQIHKCIRCYATAYEVKEGLYKCSNEECGFEWEIIKCG